MRACICPKSGCGSRVAAKRFRLFVLPVVLIFMCAWSLPASAQLAVIVNPENPLIDLSIEDVRRIFMGRLKLFPESSWKTEPVDLPDTHEAYASFYRAAAKVDVARLQRLRAAYLFSGAGTLPATLPDAAAVIRHVAATPAAIGYVDASLVNRSVKVVVLIP